METNIKLLIYIALLRIATWSDVVESASTTIRDPDKARSVSAST